MRRWTTNRPWTRVVACTLTLAIGGAVLAAPVASARADQVPSSPTWTPPPGSLPDGGSAFLLIREPETTYPGASFATTGERSDIAVIHQSTRVIVDVSGDNDANVGFAVPTDQDVEPGFHAYDPVTSGLTFTVDHGGCADSGWVDIGAAHTEAGVLQHLELTFEIVCGNVYHGALRWDAATPPGAPNPIVPVPEDLWTPPSGSLPSTANAAYVDSGRDAIDGLTATGTAVTGYDDTNDPYDERGDDWRFALGTGEHVVRGIIQAGRHDDALRVGLYAGLFDTGVNGVTGGFGLSEGSSAMGSCPSWFAIDELTRTNGHITHIAFRFEHDCSPQGQVTHGAVRWTAQPALTALAPDHGLSRGGTEVWFEGIDLVDVTAVTVGGVDAALVRDTWGGVRGFRTPALPVGAHEVRITAAGGEAVGTGATAFTSIPDTPAAPASVTVTPGPARAVVEWQPPLDLGAGTITGVRLDLYGRSNQEGDPPERTVTVGPDDSAAVWGDLAPGHDYRFAVTYLSSLGSGDTWDQPHSYYRIPDADVVPFDEVPTLVTQQYIDFAGRAPTTAERNAAVADIRTGKKLPEAYVASMRNRPEWGGVRAPMTRLYSAYFGRLPDAGGLAYWSKKLRSGTSLAKASATFAASSEFKRKYGSLSNGAFVDLIYRNVLHRSADPGGRTFWVAKLNAGADRGSVMAGFSESSEHIRKMAPTVDAVLLYTGMLRRMPTAAEVPLTGLASDSTRASAADPTDPVALAEQLRHSPAYAARF